MPSDTVTLAQRQSLRYLLDSVRGSNAFYRRKLDGIDFEPDAGDLALLPFTTRAELQKDQEAHPPYGTNLTEPVEDYRRFHQTSGTHGRPMRWLDTPDSWQALTDCWCTIFTAAGVGASDRILFPFSFGPFLGFWVAFDGASRLGAMVIPAGGTSTLGRLQMIAENAVTVVCCTPTYALHMAEVAAGHGIDLAASTVKSLIVAGEPGGNIPEVRAKIEKAWGARLFDHHGMTEVGPVSFECHEKPGGLHINEEHYLAEVIDPSTLQAVPDGTPGELVLTTLLRKASPLIRYRTGDQVILTRGKCACGRYYARLEGGILGRVDDMFTVRGNNVFPSAVEAILRRFDEVAEFRLTVFDRGPLAAVQLEVEPVSATIDARSLCEKVSRTIHDELHFKAGVTPVEVGSLPRFEMKAKRFVRK
ncbi:AMP-binding protein [Humisphaera borealis]|uniref:AMP-binding protein n=2 Tax=Humisphaera borealis TaxID=2807512 RepID=A0A7M2X460_9BACT|nr:AMP-binding protein [Humisphaera borealis]